VTTIVADVGGTNTRVGLAENGRCDRASVARFRNAEFASLGDLLSRYLAGHPGTVPGSACVAVAGPVRGGTGRLTNLDWNVSEASLCLATGARRGHVLNDLAAQGHALDMVPLQPVHPVAASADPAETRLVIGVGTGFNAAPVYRRPSGLMVAASECGHVTLPVWNDASRHLARGLTESHGFASVEELLSGRGLPNAFAILTGSPAPDEPRDILAAAAAEPTGRAAGVLDTIIGTFGRVVGDLALTHLPFGGIVLIGGMARAYLPFLAAHGFFEGMTDKGRFADFMAQFPLFVMEDDFAALDGCAQFALAEES